MKTLIKLLFKLLIRRFVRPILPLILNELETLKKEKEKEEVIKILGQLQSCGFGVRINGRIVITDPKSVIIGNNVHIGNNAYFASEGGLVIGDNTHISRNVVIYTVNHNYQGKALPYDSTVIQKPVLIGKNVWIGMNVSIAPGVHIGDGAIVGIGAVVARDVPPYSIVGLPPVRILKYRDAGHYTQLENERRYGGINGVPLFKEEIEQFGLHADSPNVKLFFIVTTGRSGSMTIARTLSQHPQIICRHEPRPQLIRLSTELAHREKPIHLVKKELYYIYQFSVFPKDKIYGESDQKFFNLITLLSELLPNSKFIWLVRDGRDVVASTYGRGWFSPQESEGSYLTTDLNRRWQYYRLNGAKCGALCKEEWEEMSVFEKNCWYWAYVNKEIEKQLISLPQDRWTVVRLEELSREISNLFRFLSLDPVPVNVRRYNIASYNVVRWPDWDRQSRKSFEQLCGEMMDKLYPGWRDKQGKWYEISHPQH